MKPSKNNTAILGFWSAVLTALLTIVTFGFAMTAVPISGAFSPGGGAAYPYLDTVSQFPKDFRWMFFALLLIPAYMVLMASIHSYADEKRKIFSRAGLGFAVITAVILMSNYYIQLSVVPASLIKQETAGIPLLIQYNSHGIFIAMEELGYLMMSLSFLFMAPVFTGKTRRESAVRLVFFLAFALTMISLAVILARYGTARQDRFEVAVISINWLALIINGVLLSLLFKKQT